jgi:hypothetical protein
MRNGTFEDFHCFGHAGIVRSHPSHEDKNVARVGHPQWDSWYPTLSPSARKDEAPQGNRIWNCAEAAVILPV